MSERADRVDQGAAPPAATDADQVLRELEAGRSELAEMVAALDAAHEELTRAAEHLATGGDTARVLRDVLSKLVPEIDRPAVLVDGDLWVIACNEPAAEERGCDRSELTGSSLARWPHALERVRAVRRALDEPAGPLAADHGDVVVSLGLDDDALPNAERMVLLLLRS